MVRDPRVDLGEPPSVGLARSLIPIRPFGPTAASRGVPTRVGRTAIVPGPRNGKGVGLPVREQQMDQPGVVENERLARRRRDLIPLYALATAVLCAAGCWYLLRELAPLLRPLSLAVFLAYTIVPVHR